MVRGGRFLGGRRVAAGAKDGRRRRPPAGPALSSQRNSSPNTMVALLEVGSVSGIRVRDGGAAACRLDISTHHRHHVLRKRVVVSSALGRPAALDREIGDGRLGLPHIARGSCLLGSHRGDCSCGRRLAVLFRGGRAVFDAIGRSVRELWRNITRQSPSYPDERAARAERARRVREETQRWDQQHHTPPPGGPPLGGPPSG
jgi:hypothetical protein